MIFFSINYKHVFNKKKKKNQATFTIKIETKYEIVRVYK